jgi:hypothetical protein
MLHFFKFSSEVEAPVPARESYVKRPPGKGWPEECPPLRAANAFGWDVLVSSEMVFRQENGSWRLEKEVELESDWVYSPEDHGSARGAPGEHAHGPGEECGEECAGEEGVPLTQKNAWFWEEDQVLPHVISRDVYPQIRNQVKVSTFLFLYTDPNELLFITDIPSLVRPFRVLTALVDADWYPASYPWHCVLELDPTQEKIVLEKGTPLCRLMTVRRDSYFAKEMSPPEFERFFQRGQEWLSRHGKGEPGGMMDITRTYVRQQQKAQFSVIL